MGHESLMKRNFAGTAVGAGVIVVAGRNAEEEVDQGEEVQAGGRDEVGVGQGEGAEAGPGGEAEVKGEEAGACLKGKVEDQEARSEAGDQEARIGKDPKVKTREDR